MKVFLPLNIRIDNKKLLFVGGGSLAIHKIRTIEQYTRNITILAPRIHDDLKGKGFTEVCKEYGKSDLEGFFLVYASTGHIEIDRRVRDDAESLGMLVNVVDNRELSGFISPAVLKYDDMTIAVSSNGRNAKKSVEWRNRLREMVKNGDL